jgi:C4-dicarboxylate-specific signal transduction histidine kinase
MTENTVPEQAIPCAKISLHKVVSELVQSLLPLTVRRHNLVLNEIPRDLCVGADENMLAYVLWNLINGAIQSTQNECIHIEAITMDDRMMIRIKDVGTYFHHTISREYRQVQDVAEKLGGSISIENGKDFGTNAAFCISNSPLAA